MVGELLGAGLVPEAILLDGARTDEATAALADMARASGMRLEVVETHVIAEIADASTPQPILAVSRIPQWSWDDVPPGTVVVLDGVQDPGNTGALIRTSVALGAAAVIVLPPGADPWGPKAVRASAGAGLRRPVFRADRQDTVGELSRRGIPVWVADAAGEPFSRVDGVAQAALVLGSEAHGVSSAMRHAAVRTVSIPMCEEAESLNVAAAGAILLDRLIGR